MNQDELNELFVQGKCEELSKQGYVDEFECRKLYREYQKSLVGRCKCKYRGLRRSYCGKFARLIKNSS
tara:strand:- start:524 stop:727 length:204 start_codon:yes stop_codon:yes gene_type:complete